MTRHFSAQSLNVQTLAESGEPLIESTLLQNMERLRNEIRRLQPETDNKTRITWRATADIRDAGAIWLHLQATTTVPLTCQRCMSEVLIPLEVDQIYRFVATEAIAMAEDDAAEEDLLVLTPQFDLLAVLEDELLMALPLVPMHAMCPVEVVMAAGELPASVATPEKPNPFAVLAQLKVKK